MNLFNEIEKSVERTYTHRKELSPRGNHIFREVLKAMQFAEEIEGVEGQDYINLMNEIGKEASQRIVNFLSWHEENNRG